MDKAKAAVSSFLHKDGKHDTTVHETVNPAIVNEHVTKTHHEDVQKVVDREVHQDHYHTSVQPITDREVVPEKHTHNMVDVEHREIRHGDEAHIKERLAAEAAQFKDTREVGETQHTHSAAPTVAGEHVHHHVHETIQPVIQKETIQPSVVHTTIPVHEVHHNEAKHHTASALPAVTMSEFQRQGGSLGGREERTDAFQGEPRSVGGTLGGAGAAGSTSLTEKEGLGGRGTTGSNTTGTGLTGTRDNIGTTGTTGTTGTRDNFGTTGTTGTGTGLTGTRRDNVDSTGTTGNTGYSTGTTGTTTSTTTGTTTGKPSLMDRMNPNKDTTGDGVAGFMK